MCITNWGKLVLQIGTALFYYKLRQTLLQIGASVVTNWGSYYNLGQPLLQNRAAITNWGKVYYKLGQVLQIRTIITNWGRTCKMYVQNVCFISLIFPVTGIELFSLKVFD